MGEIKERCETCKFWGDGDVLVGGRIGYCSRFPPIAVKWEMVDELNGENPHGVWPVTYDVQWCGEWKVAGVAEQPQGELFPWSEVKHPWGKKIRAAIKREGAGHRDPPWKCAGLSRFPETFADVLQFGRDEMLELYNIGITAVSAVDAVMESHGFGNQWKL